MPTISRERVKQILILNISRDMGESSYPVMYHNLSLGADWQKIIITSILSNTRARQIKTMRDYHVALVSSNLASWASLLFHFHIITFD